MALFYKSSTTHTANFGGSNNSDPSIHAAVWLSYQLTDWVNRLGPAYAAIKYNHEDWDAYGGFIATSRMHLQLALRGADYRAGVDSGDEHGLYWTMSGDSNGYFYWYKNNYTGSQASAGSGGGLGDWGTQMDDQLLQLRYHLRPSAFSLPRLAQVMFSDTPGKRFFAFDIFGQRGIIDEASDMAHTGIGLDQGWLCNYSSLAGQAWRGSSDSSDMNYYSNNDTAFSVSSTVGFSKTSEFKGIKDKLPVADYFGRYSCVSTNCAYSQFQLPVGWRWLYEGREFVSWTPYVLIEITGMTDG